MGKISIDTSNDELLEIKKLIKKLDDVQMLDLWYYVEGKLDEIDKVVNINQNRVYYKFESSCTEQCYLDDKDIYYASVRARDYSRRINE